MSFELNRKLAARRAPLPTTANVDAVTADIIRGAFETVCFEAATHLGRAASSPIINQSNERNAAIVDAHGRLAMGAIGTPHLTFVNPMMVRWGLMNLETYDWGPGDIFLSNDPDHGGGHLPDYCVYAPVYDAKGELIVVQTLQAHQGDTGGKDPGGFTLEATDIFTEGVSFPCVKLVHRGERRNDLIHMIERNNRFATFKGDLAAMIGAVQRGVTMLESLIARWGSDPVKAAINHSIDQTERRMRAEVSNWPDGTYEATVLIDHDTLGTKDVKVHVACRVEGDQLTVDLTGTDDRPNLVGVWNTFANSRSYIMTQLCAAADPAIVKNEGMFNAVEIVIPEGCIANPPPNKPAALGSFHPACEITEAVCIALSAVVPERSAPQLYKIGMPNAVIGFDAKGQMWMDQGVDCRSMDVSAIEGIDGWGSCPVSLGNLLLSEAEDAECRFPILNISREMTTDGGGAGQWRGAPGMHHRYLVGVPMVKVETLGAGGGSICHVKGGSLQVGPQSAGSEPGPICYGRGGMQPTVTDALVMLGILSTDEGFAGGSFTLKRDGVEAAFATLGGEMGTSAEQAAFDCWRVVNASMSQGVRRTTAGKGIDPKDLVMLAYGGNGPAFAAIQAEDLGIAKVLVPKASPTFSALGTLVANPAIDEERSCIAPANALDLGKLRALWTDLADRATRYFGAAGFTAGQVSATYQLNMRYPGQNFALTFDIHPGGTLGDLSFVDDGLGERATAMFNERHLAEYNHIRDHELPEVVGVRLATSVETPSPIVATGDAPAVAAPKSAKSRRANLGQGFAETPVYLGRDLKPGHVVAAPAIIEETFTTIVVYPGWSARVDAAGDYTLDRVS